MKHTIFVVGKPFREKARVIMAENMPRGIQILEDTVSTYKKLTKYLKKENNELEREVKALKKEIQTLKKEEMSEEKNNLLR